MRTGRRLALAALLVAAAACKDKKKESEQPPAAPPGERAAPASSSPASEPDLPAQVSLDCARIVPDQVRAAHLAGLAVVETSRPPIATCAFGDPPRPSVSLFCQRRKRDWNFADEIARDERKTAIGGVGRAAYARDDHLFFYPAKLDCLARVIWPADLARATALARALDPLLSKETVTAAPVR